GRAPVQSVVRPVGKTLAHRIGQACPPDRQGPGQRTVALGRGGRPPPRRSVRRVPVADRRNETRCPHLEAAGALNFNRSQPPSVLSNLKEGPLTRTSRSEQHTVFYPSVC